ncbi:T9SS type A sorting domain-containing protein [Marine Group I thaumarchaeote]|uniref:T9SS type A sorting domain-containing protein n=1 Tax=Marine Group I thaumarchaeote TaxID=2511932 RepID=A0A7K4MQ25_9ARCH|nr:T9SS type A sorting domain-containing protein [Marine Group I thaumarchaeote]
MITEIFILTADSIPQYLEFYNNSDSLVSLENWSIKILNGNGEEIFESPIDNSNLNVQANNFDINFDINPNDYFLISSEFCNSTVGFLELGCNDGFFHNNLISDIIAKYLYLPLDGKGSIILIDKNQIVIDSVGYNIDENWPVGEVSRGHSLRLHSPELDNSLSENWSLSPKTENSLWLYTENSEIKNFGSPREENAFRLLGVNNFYHIISGDVNNIYNADNNYEDNNYGKPIDFSWYGTFDNVSGQQYKLIIEKTDTKKPEKHGFEIESFADTTLIWESIIGIDTSIIPQSMLVDQLEVAEYSWTMELTKGSDIIYSDRHYFSVDASDYGIYGCVDKSFCEISSLGFPNCPTTADDDTLFSNHPIVCTPGVDCYSALNYYENANINSSTCHYVSLSIPAYVVGNTNSTARVPVYLYNDSLANIDSIAYTLSFDNSSGIAAFQDGTFSGTVETELWGDENIVGDQNGNISVSMLTPADSSFQGAGIITYLDFNLTGSQGEFINLSFSEVLVKGGIPENNISVPVSGGEVVILQADYEISGNITYYRGDNSWEIPNVKLSLDKNYDGVSSGIIYLDTTNNAGSFEFNLLSEGNYNLSFSKSPDNDCNDDAIKGTDISRISRHVTGSEPFNADEIIAADVTLDGTVSGYDVSLVAQYYVDLIDNFNYLNTHWIFKPFNQETLPNVHAELVKENGQYSIEYKPLVLDDKHRKISAYRLGDALGDYCKPTPGRFNNGQIQFINIAIDYTPIITLPIIISEPTFIEGIDIEIGFDEDVFNPLSITFNNSNKVVENYQTVSNLLSKDRTIKTVTWALDEPQLIEGVIGEVNFEWKNKNKSGKIWLKKFQVNDGPGIGGISLIGLSDTEVSTGVNIIYSMVPEKLSLHQNYPNPFNPQTKIYWSMPLSGIVSLEVYNLQGQLVELLFNGQLDTGSHEQIWDATTYPSGIYFYRLKTHEKTLQKIMLLLK